MAQNQVENKKEIDIYDARQRKIVKPIGDCYFILTQPVADVNRTIRLKSGEQKQIEDITVVGKPLSGKYESATEYDSQTLPDGRTINVRKVYDAEDIDNEEVILQFSITAKRSLLNAYANKDINIGDRIHIVTVMKAGKLYVNKIAKA